MARVSSNGGGRRRRALCLAGVARAGDVGHGRGHGGHGWVPEVAACRSEVVGGRGVDQRDDDDEFGGDRSPARSGSGF